MKIKSLGVPVGDVSAKPGKVPSAGRFKQPAARTVLSNVSGNKPAKSPITPVKTDRGAFGMK